MTILELKETLRFHGRVSFLENGSLSLWWSYAGFSFRFRGESFAVTTAAFIDDQPTHLAVIIDGTTYKSVVGLEAKEHTFTVKNGEHTVEVRRCSNRAASPDLQITALCADGELLPPPAEKQMKIEFVGDSITCGYGILGAHGTGYFSKDEDCTVNYAALTAAHFNAEARYVSMSGRGIVHNCDRSNGNLVPHLFMRSGRAINTAAWLFNDGFTPDVLVVNAGTNDVGGGTTPEEMETAAVWFLRDIRTRYPNAKIIWTYGMMNRQFIPALEKAIETVRQTDKNVWFLPTTSISAHPGETGANGHPGVLGHRRVAKELIALIESIL